MSLSPNSFPYYDVLGWFVHKETKAGFEYKKTDPYPCSFLEGLDFPHEVFMSDGSTRFARVLKTVAYVVVDIDGDKPVVEKWPIVSKWAR